MLRNNLTDSKAQILQKLIIMSNFE